MYSLAEVLNLASQQIGPFDGKAPNRQPTNRVWMDGLFGFNDDNDHPNSLFKEASNVIQQTIIIKQLFESRYDPSTGILKTNQGNYRAGWFVAPTVKEIKDLVASIPGLKGGGSAVGMVVQGMDVGRAHVEAQALELFQGASQMNALEMVNMDVVPNDGINNYVDDPTQGPRTALACAPGTLIRNYWLPMISGGQYNMLENLKLSHINGYLIWGTSPDELIYKLNGDQITISSMLYTEVTGITVAPNNATHENDFFEHRSTKLMHQIYSAAAPIDTYRNGGNQKQQLKINSELLTAQYIGVIGLSLILHYYDSISGRTSLKRPRVNLTLVGGGVFNVPEPLIFDCIQSAITYYNGYSFELYIHGFQAKTATSISNFFKIPIGSLGTLQPSIQQPPVQQPQYQQPSYRQSSVQQPPYQQPQYQQPQYQQPQYQQPQYQQPYQQPQYQQPQYQQPYHNNNSTNNHRMFNNRFL